MDFDISEEKKELISDLIPAFFERLSKNKFTNGETLSVLSTMMIAIFKSGDCTQEDADFLLGSISIFYKDLSDLGK